MIYKKSKKKLKTKTRKTRKTRKQKGGNINTYDSVNNFQLDGDKYLIYDMFARNNSLIIVCSKSATTDNIIVKYLDNILKVDKKVEKHASLLILFYTINPNENNLNINISYNNINKDYNLEYKNFTDKKGNLSIATLFKDDYYLLPIFIDYYTKQGIEHFYMYYNGKLENLNIDESIKNNPNVSFIEWNYPYYSEKPRIAIAQPSQLNTFLYKYGKPLWNYTLFNDLDEYLYIKNNNILLKDYINKDKFKDIDTFGFVNTWADTVNKDIPCKDSNTCVFPNQINISSITNPYSDRSKNIHKTSSIDTIQNIHILDNHLYSIANPKINTDNNNVIFHFFRWSPSHVDHGQRDTVEGYTNPILFTI